MPRRQSEVRRAPRQLRQTNPSRLETDALDHAQAKKPMRQSKSNLLSQSSAPVTTILQARRNALLRKQLTQRRDHAIAIRSILRLAPKDRGEAELEILQEWASPSIPSRSQDSLRLDLLGQTAAYLHLKKGQPLLAQRDLGSHFYIVLSGRLSEYEALGESVLDEHQSADPSPAELQARAAERASLLTQLIAHHKREAATKTHVAEGSPVQHKKREPWGKRIIKRKLQAAMLARLLKFVSKLKETTVKSRLQRAAAATKVQALHRGKAQRNSAQAGSEEEERSKAAARLQARQRGRSARRDIEGRREKRKNAKKETSRGEDLLKPASVKGKQYNNERRVDNTSRTETISRFYVDEETTRAANQAAAKVQAAQREKIAHQKMLEIQRQEQEAAREAAAVTLQAATRGRHAGKTFNDQKKAVQTMQANARGRQARTRVEDMHCAATHIQTYERKLISRRRTEQMRNEIHLAASTGGLHEVHQFIFVRTGSVELGKSFGDLALLFGETHHSSVIADRSTELAVVDRTKYLAALEGLMHGLIAQRADFLASLPVFRMINSEARESLTSVAGALLTSDFQHGDRVPLTSSKMLLVSKGELVISRVRKQSGTKPLLVIGPGSFYGASPLTRRLDGQGDISLVGFSECSVLWVDPSHIQSRLGTRCLESVAAQEEASIRIALGKAGESVRPATSSVWTHGPLTRTFKHSASMANLPPKSKSPSQFRTLGLPDAPRGLLAPGISMRHLHNSRQLNIFDDSMDDDGSSGSSEVKVPLPRSADPHPGGMKPSASLPALPPPSPPGPPTTAHARPDGRWAGMASWSRPASPGGYAFGHPSTSEPSRRGAILLRPGTAVIALSPGKMIIEDNHGRWTELNRVSMNLFGEWPRPESRA